MNNQVVDHIFSIGFYNLENLFDPLHAEHTRDTDYTPAGHFRWDEAKYFNKIRNLSKAISRIGAGRAPAPPVILGLCEVENASCLEDLVKDKSLESFNYGFVHFESPDPRGIDTALLYRKDAFKVLNAKAHRIELKTENTRDILSVEGELYGERLNVLVNHWPSKVKGNKQSKIKRDVTSRKMAAVIDEILRQNETANIISIGDFNEQPAHKSISKYLSQEFFNPMLELAEQDQGSVRHRGKWMMLDQILISQGLKNSETIRYESTYVGKAPYLLQEKGRRKGAPLRTYLGSFHLGGYSDHLPVYSLFSRKK